MEIISVCMIRNALLGTNPKNEILTLLSINSSDSESEAEEENDDTAATRGERSPHHQISHHHHHQEYSLASIDGGSADGDDSNNTTTTTIVDNQQVQDARPKPNFRARRLLTPTRVSGLETVLASHVRKSRKRCASTPSPLNMGQSNSEELRDLNPPTNKKRRFPSISLSGPGPYSNNNTNGSGGLSGGNTAAENNQGNLSSGDYAIRKRMMQDIEDLQKQFQQLDNLEKLQHDLMLRYMEINQQYQPSGTIQQQRQPSSGDSNGTNTSTTAITTTTTATTTEQELGIDVNNPVRVGGENIVGEIEQVEPVMAIEEEGIDEEEDINVMNDDEIFSDADLIIGAEETVDNISAEEDSEIGSLM